MIADKGCAERGCPCYDAREGPGVQLHTVDELGRYYEMGWNAALEMAAFKLTHEFKAAFGDDTLASIAVYLKGIKK